MSFLRGGTPLMGAVPSLEAANQAQIEDLVQRNRTLEHANKKLSEQVAQERQRAQDNLDNVESLWKQKQEYWKQVCEDILTSCRIVQKRLEVETEASRSAVIKEMAVTREEKLQRLQRDFKIRLFQMKEEELERKIEELEDEKAKIAEEAELVLQTQREKCIKHTAKLRETREALARSLKENERKEEKYNKLVAERSNMEAKKGTLDSQLQRVQLQLEGSRTKITELERTNDELKRTIADQGRQLERWQNLETKGGEAAEKHHKEKVELKFRLQELEEAFEKQREEHEKELEKERNRTQKVKDAMENWQAEAKRRENNLKDANKQVAKLQKLVDKLKEDLETERARVRPPSPQKPRVASTPSDDDDIEEVEESEPPTRQRRTSAKPESTTTTIKPPIANGSKASFGRPMGQVARKSTGGKPPARPKRAQTPIEVDAEDISEAEAEDKPPAVNKKQKAKAKASDNEEEQGIEDHPKQKQKRKATTDQEQRDEDDVQIVEKAKPRKKGSRTPSELRETNAGGTRTKPGSRAASRQPSAKSQLDNIGEEEEEEQSQTVPKKKRKIGGQPPPGPFAFDSLGLFDDKPNANGLGIPTVLSPIRDGEPVPQRSTASFLGRFTSTIGFARK